MININLPNAAADFSGHQLGSYRLVRLLGYGGFASVYLAEHLYLKRPAAIKLLRTVLDDRGQRRFLEEARLLANLSHPHIVRVLEFAIAQRWTTLRYSRIKENIPFLVMDYAPGGNLRRLYPATTPLPLEMVINNIKQVAAALQYAHEQNIIHRDIKPENLLVSERREIMLSDFGLALFAPSADFMSLQGMVGTLPYTAPEQLQGRPVFASDQYSLAILAYEWLCGHRPFYGEDVEIIMHHVSSPPPRLRHRNLSISQPVEDVVFKALAKDPRQRYRTVQAFAQALEQAGRLEKSFSLVGLSAPVALATFPEKGNFPAFRFLVQKEAVAAPERRDEVSSQRAPDLKSRHVSALSSSMQRNRWRMIQKVRAFWVKGVLEKSLRGASFITLGVDEKPDAVDNPWSSTLQAQKHAQSLAPDIPITEFYDQAGGELLILGEAGSGKTTLLLELARHLLNRAERDESLPIPVVFLLSSWAEKQLPLDRWLLEELSSKYQVPRVLGELWIRHEMLLPLLDGLDEVASHARSACVTAINTYKKERGLSSLVVASRLTEYLLFPPRVLLQSAVVVRALTMEQIKGYLRNAGEKFEVIYQMLHDDPSLQRLVTTPLMLNIITLAYQDRSLEDLLYLHSSMARYHRILSTYVEQMLYRHTNATSYSPQECVERLAYLARNMQLHDERVFYIEQLQPKWIDKRKWLQVYLWLAVLLPGVLIGALTGIVSNDLFFHAGIVDSVFIDGLYGAFIGSLLSGRDIRAGVSEKQPAMQAKEEEKKPSRAGKYILTAIFTGLLSCLLLGLSKGWMDGMINGAFLGVMSLLLSLLMRKRTNAQSRNATMNNGRLKRFSLEHLRNGMIIGLVCGVSSALTTIVIQGFFSQSLLFLVALALRDTLRSSLLGTLLSLLLENNDGTIHRAEIIIWSWKRFWRQLLSPRYAITGLLVGLVIGLSYGVKQALQGNWDNVLSAGLSDGLFLALGYYLVATLFQAISSHNLDDRRRYRPNEGIYRSLRYGLVGGAIGILMCGCGYVLSRALSLAISSELTTLEKEKKGPLSWSLDGFKSGFQHGLHVDIRNVLLLGIVGGLLTGLLMGALPWLQHGVLRLILWKTRVLPLKLARFLDYAVDCVFLHKVGGGYLFIHRLLLEYFASPAQKEVHSAEHVSEEPEVLVRLL